MAARHRHETQLRWSDADMLGHLNHVRLPGEDHARLEVAYLAQVRYRVGEVLPVETWVSRLGTKSIVLRQELAQDGKVALRTDAYCVAFDYDTDTSRPLDSDERDFWSDYLETAP